MTFAGDPAPNVDVKLCEKFAAIAIAGGGGCSGAIVKSKADASGHFVFRDVKAGTYEALLVRVFDTASFQYSSSVEDIFGAAKQEVTAGGTLDAGVTALVKHDIAFAAPQQMARTTPTPTIRWGAYPKATCTA